MREDPWTLFWRADHLESCVAQCNETDAAGIAELWQRFARELETGSRVLDLATGNGAVPRHLLAAEPTLRITAVDLADIDPVRFVSGAPELQSVHFMGGIDICSLPFESGSFQALTSQFGFEYAPLIPATESCCRVLAKGGSMLLLLHHVGSEVVRSTGVALMEMESLLRQAGVVDTLVQFAHKKLPVQVLEDAGRAHLAADCKKSKHLTGQVFEGINRVIVGNKDNAADAASLAANIAVRLRAERARLTRLQSAALDEAKITKLRSLLRSGGVQVDIVEPLEVGGADDPALIGWQVHGCRL